MNHSKESLILHIEQYKIKLADKEEENRQLRARAYEWKKKALENESLNHTIILQYEEQEKQLILNHENQMNALTSAHVEKMNDMSNLILKLQEQLDQSFEQKNHHYHYEQHQLSSTTSSLSSSYIDSSDDIIKDIHISDNSNTIHHRPKATDLILNMNDLMVDIETRINDYIAINHINHEDENSISDGFETNISSDEEDENSHHHQYNYDQDENKNHSSIELKNTNLSSATSIISPSIHQQENDHHYTIKNQSIQQYHSPIYNNNNNNDNHHQEYIEGIDDDDNDDIDSHSLLSIYNYPNITETNSLYKKKNRSSFSFFSNSSSMQPSNPILHSKPTMEHLSKVIPSFLKKPMKSEQWKISHRHSVYR